MYGVTTKCKLNPQQVQHSSVVETQTSMQEYRVQIPSMLDHILLFFVIYKIEKIEKKRKLPKRGLEPRPPV